jgi:hypothetical protein
MRTMTGLIYSLTPPHAHVTSRVHRHKATTSDFSIVNRGLLDQEQFLKAIKDDVKPYLQYLFHTRSFKVHISLSTN